MRNLALRLLALFLAFVLWFMNAAVPERAIVPRFSISSSRFMPMPLSATVSVREDFTGVSTTR